MERIAFISGGAFIYWSPIITALAIAAAVCIYAAVYLKRDGNVFALSLSIPLALAAGFPLSRLVHWYARTPSYVSFYAAMTDYSSGGYALIGAFAGCLVVCLLLRALRISKSLPRMLDAMAIGGGAGIGVGRLASVFNSSDRGMILPEQVGMPFASPVINAVSGAAENRLATFMVQSIFVFALVAALVLYMAWCALRKKKIPDGDLGLMFLLVYGASQIICDSTRYDSLFLRSNGFVSIVQILGLVAYVAALGIFIFRLIRNRGMKAWYLALWIPILAALGLAGYMEYYVQRHGTEAVFAYGLMSLGLAIAVILALVIRRLGLPEKTKGKYAQ